jgi:hypothetical protein
MQVLSSSSDRIKREVLEPREKDEDEDEDEHE